MPLVNILFIIEYLANGGTEKQLMSLISGLDRDKFAPHLCCLRYSVIGENRRKEAEDLFRMINCEKIIIDFISLQNLKSYVELHRLVKFVYQHNINIIQSYFQDPTLVNILLSKVCGIKHTVACFRDMAFWHEDVNNLKWKTIYKLCTNYISNSYAVRNKYIELFNLRESKFNVIYNGIQIESNKHLPPNNNFQTTDKIVAIVANLNRRVKRVDVFLKAAAEIRSRRPGVRFLIVGDGELKEELILLSNNLGLAGTVDFVGRVNNVNAWLTKVDIGVISSDSEGFSNAILEYMVAGIPVVATDSGGNMELIENGENGFLVQIGDYHALSEKINELLDDKELYNRIREKAYDRVCKNFSLSHSIACYEQLYSKLTSNKG